MQKSDLFNFVVTIPADNGDIIQIFVPQPNEHEIKMLAYILGKFYTELKKNKLDSAVLMQDWDLIVEEALESLSAEKQDNIKARLNSFFERALMSVKMISKGTEIKTLSDNEKTLFKGTLLFILALFRYSTPAIFKSELKDFYTLQSASDWKDSLMSFEGGFTQKETKKKLSVKV